MSNEAASERAVPAQPPAEGRAASGKRREATVLEARALGHPLRLRILRLCSEAELTNKQIADRLGRDPGTVLYHVRQLVDAGFLEQGAVRTGESGALEKPYRSTGKSWWLENPAGAGPAAVGIAPIEAFQEELAEAGPDSVATFARFTLHLSPAEVAELDRRIVAVLDEFMETDRDRSDRPALGGLFVLHRLAGPPPAAP